MNVKNGLVMEIRGDAAYLMSPSGEFVKVKIDKRKSLPVVGGEYSGKAYNNASTGISKFKYIAAACLMFFILSLSGGAYAYYTPVSTVTININPSIEFKLNRWKRVVASKPLNSDGEKILKEIATKNTNIDDALVMVINQAKEDKYINDNYINNGKTITVNITGKETSLPNLEKELSKNDLNAKIDNNGTTVFNKTTDNVSPKNNNSNLNKANNNENNSSADGNKSKVIENKQSTDKNTSNPNKNYNELNNNSNNANNNESKNNNSSEDNKKYNDNSDKSKVNIDKSNENKQNYDKENKESKEDKTNKSDNQDKGNKNKEK